MGPGLRLLGAEDTPGHLDAARPGGALTAPRGLSSLALVPDTPAAGPGGCGSRHPLAPAPEKYSPAQGPASAMGTQVL